jgi:hypothetical protein
MAQEEFSFMRPRLAIEDKGWWHDIREHRKAVVLFILLLALDYSLTVFALSQGGREVNPFTRELSVPAFAVLKSCLTVAAIMWLATWRWLRYLKWLNVFYIAVACGNIYQLTKLLS